MITLLIRVFRIICGRIHQARPGGTTLVVSASQPCCARLGAAAPNMMSNEIIYHDLRFFAYTNEGRGRQSKEVCDRINERRGNH